MQTKPDILIIGGGVIGVCSAYYLAKAGAQVTLIEKDEIGAACSYGNSGLIVPSHSIPLASPGALGEGLRFLLDARSPFYIKPRLDADLFRWLAGFVSASNRGRMLRSLPVLRDLLFASRALYDELAASAGFDFGFQTDGSLWVCLSEEKLAHEIKELRVLKEFDVPFEIVDSKRAHELEPALQPAIRGGIFYPRDGKIHPHRFVTGLAGRATEAGVSVWARTEALGFETRDGRIVKVRTTRGDVAPAQVVVSAGAWSPQVAKMLNLRVPIQAAKGYSLTYENPELTPKLPLFFGEAGMVANPLGDSLRLAGTLEMAGMDFSYNAARIEAMRKSSLAYLRGLENARLIELWRGLRPCTPDGLPIIGRADTLKNCIVAAGHAMLGMSLGPVTGRLVAQLALEQKTDLDIAQLSLNRF